MTPERRARINQVLNCRQPELAIVLENVFDPHNIAAVLRTADSVGVQDVYVLNTKIERHKKFGKKSSASAVNWLTIHAFDTVEACFTELRNKYQKIFATHLGIASKSLYELNLTESVALVFGNEHSGVSEDALQWCDGNFIIPQVGMVKSLNISVACAVSLYEALRQREKQGMYAQSRLSDFSRKQLSEKWNLSDE
ncbi:MAG: RNA methyltransferase [Bacteroidetes bacterium]|nr:RNA methyltransferase [Bacteroidota bacterium]MBS1740343.1 RNA methyltransferase [Bacteroidota bacterium]